MLNQIIIIMIINELRVKIHTQWEVVNQKYDVKSKL